MLDCGVLCLDVRCPLGKCLLAERPRWSRRHLCGIYCIRIIVDPSELRHSTQRSEKLLLRKRGEKLGRLPCSLVTTALPMRSRKGKREELDLRPGVTPRDAVFLCSCMRCLASVSLLSQCLQRCDAVWCAAKQMFERVVADAKLFGVIAFVAGVEAHSCVTSTQN